MTEGDSDMAEASAVTEQAMEQAREMLDLLRGNRAEAVAYSENPEEWVNEHGYEDVPAEAVAACGVGGGATATASSGGGGGYSGPAPAPGGGVAGTLEQVDYVVYNYYGDDNSITTNIANNGYLDFDQTIQQVEGDGNVLAGDDLNNQGGQIQTGDGLQAGGDIDIDDSAVATGGGDADNISDIDIDAGGGQVGNVAIGNEGDTAQAAVQEDNDGIDADVDLGD
jgi:hypothetical protein